MELPDLPEGWEISFICQREPGEWVADVINREIDGYVYTKGASMRSVLLAAVTQITDGEFWTKSDRASRERVGPDLVKFLNIPQPPPSKMRRL